MQRVILTTAVAGLLLMALLSACAINEVEPEELGAVTISAIDTSTMVTLESAQVLFGEVLQGKELPLTVGGLPAGDIDVTIRPGISYPSKTQTVTINPPDTTQVVFEYSTSDVTSFVTVASNEADAIIVINETFQPDLAVGAQFSLPAGFYAISLFKEGYANNSPYAYKQEFGAGEVTLTLDLTDISYGNQTGDYFPDFSFPDDWGGTQTLGQYRGDVVLITFWFYACTPCREEFPTIESVFQERASDGFRVLGINVGWYNDDQAKFEAIRDELGLNFPLLFNTNDVSWTTQDLLIGTAPTNFIIAPNGQIHARRGQITYESLNALINEALAY